MLKKSGYSIQRTMLVYFLLIGLASLFVGIEFIADINSPRFREELVENFDAGNRAGPLSEAAFHPVEKIRNKAILMVTIIMFVIIIVLTMFTRNITEPLQHMIEVARKLAAGDLRQTVAIRSDNELAELGSVINDLSSNLQESTMLAKNVCAEGIDTLASSLERLAADNPDLGDLEKVRRELTALKAELGSLDELINCFHFYSGKK